jgi:SAM-dependent methyltransferase
MPLLSGAHARLVLSRRVRVLAERIATLLPPSATVLDVGCGDGSLAALLVRQVPGIRLQGIDVLARAFCAIPMQVYDGVVFPLPDRSVDVVLFSDVLHHTPDPLVPLREARRVARHSILIKDHLCDSGWARQVLRCMDWVGNRPHGVVLPYNYWSGAQWRAAWATLDLAPDAWLTQLGLYPALFRPLFEHRLHFLARLRPVTNPGTGG